MFLSRQEGGLGGLGRRKVDGFSKGNKHGVRVFAADMGRLCRQNGKWSAGVLITPGAPMPPSGNEMGISLCG